MKRWILVALLAATTVLAADKAPTKRRVLVADAVANGVDKGTAATLTSMLVARVGAQPDVQAYSGMELKRLMSLEADKAACGSDESCIAEITGALGAPLAVLSDVGKLGALTIVNLTLFDVENAAPLSRKAVETEKLEELPAKLDKAVADLLHSAVLPSKVRAEVIAREHKSGVLGVVGKKDSESFEADGLGLSGAGGGGAGAGIGLGGVGTIGSGSGSAPKKPAAPKPPPPSPGAAEGATLSPNEVVTVVKANQPRLMKCYDEARKQKPDLAGKIVVRFLIAADGSVAWASIQSTEIIKSSLPKCIVEKVQSWKFPAKGAPTTVSYPFVFRP